ncbi:MAG: TetR/AcrR family transcriptional regulator [Acutalibacteraceae bacterium]
MANVSNEEAKRFSKECIFTSLLSLMEQKPFDKISITEIAQNAGVSRNAVYRNFNTKEDILKDSISGITAGFIKSLKTLPIDSYDDYTLEIFRHLNETKDIGLTVMKAGMTHVLFDSFMMFKGLFDVDDRIKSYYENYRIGAIFYMYITWLENGCTETPEELMQILKQIGKISATIPKI